MNSSLLGVRCLPQMSAAESALFFDCLRTSASPTLVHSRTSEAFTRCPSLLPLQSLPVCIPRPSPSAFLWVFDWFSLPFLRTNPATIEVRTRQFVAWDTESYQISSTILQTQIITMFTGFDFLDNCSADDMMLLQDPLGQTDLTYILRYSTPNSIERHDGFATLADRAGRLDPPAQFRSQSVPLRDKTLGVLGHSHTPLTHCDFAGVLVIHSLRLRGAPRHARRRAAWVFNMAAYVQPYVKVMSYDGLRADAAFPYPGRPRTQGVSL